MPQSLSQVYLHIVFSTKHRKNLIDKEIEQRLNEYLGGICKGLDCPAIQVGSHKNHVHISCRLSRKISQMDLMEELKKRSSSWIKTVDKKYNNFYWQNGYGIFSVSAGILPKVIDYIKNQEFHHKAKSFKEEFLEFLEEYDVDYDERYLWD